MDRAAIGARFTFNQDVAGFVLFFDQILGLIGFVVVLNIFFIDLNHIAHQVWGQFDVLDLNLFRDFELTLMRIKVLLGFLVRGTVGGLEVVFRKTNIFEFYFFVFLFIGFLNLAFRNLRRSLDDSLQLLPEKTFSLAIFKVFGADAAEAKVVLVEATAEFVVFLKFGLFGNAFGQLLITDHEVHFFRFEQNEPVLDQSLQRIFLQFELSSHLIRKLAAKLIAVKIDNVGVGAIKLISLDFYPIDGGDGFIGFTDGASGSPGIENGAYKGNDNKPQKAFGQSAVSNPTEHVFTLPRLAKRC